VADPPGAQQALDGGPKALPQAALGEAPLENEGALLVPRATPAAHELFAAHFANVMKFKATLADGLVEAIYQACQVFKQGDPRGRSVPPLTVGLLWLTEGLAALPRGSSSFQVRLDPTVPSQAGHARVMETLLDAAAKDPSFEPTVQGASVTLVGLWGFGLDAVFDLSGSPTVADLDLPTATARWRSRMRSFGWTDRLPFDTIQPTFDRGTKTFTVPATELWPFLVCVAARYAEELWKLPDELLKRGDDLGADGPLVLNDRDPNLGYTTYRFVASKAAGFWEVVRFLRDFCPAVVRVGEPVPSGLGGELQGLMDVLAKWQTRISDSDFQSRAQKLIHEASAPSGRALLKRAAAATTWSSASAATLPTELADRLRGLVAAWAAYAAAFAAYADKPTQQFLHDASLPSADLQLVSAKPGLEGFELFGFGVQNFTKRYRDVTGRDPWDRPLESTATPARAIGE
jgi:hypothetical protein